MLNLFLKSQPPFERENRDYHALVERLKKIQDEKYIKQKDAAFFVERTNSQNALLSLVVTKKMKILFAAKLWQ